MPEYSSHRAKEHAKQKHTGFLYFCEHTTRFEAPSLNYYLSDQSMRIAATGPVRGSKCPYNTGRLHFNITFSLKTTELYVHSATTKFWLLDTQRKCSPRISTLSHCSPWGCCTSTLRPPLQFSGLDPGRKKVINQFYLPELASLGSWLSLVMQCLELCHQYKLCSLTLIMFNHHHSWFILKTIKFIGWPLFFNLDFYTLKSISKKPKECASIF